MARTVGRYRLISLFYRNPKVENLQMSKHRQAKLPAFVAECTLGKLAKWLRLAGFDTLYDSMPPDFRRLIRLGHSRNYVVLSRTQSVIRHLEATQGILIQFDDPMDQMRQVIRHFNIRRRDLMPLSRCSHCNCLLRPADQENIQSAVPDYVRQRHERFLMCDQCYRVYWPGTHGTRMLALIERWFA
jgi:uncharacterized protein